jgi:polyisoprenoid-binding protein YceI
MRIDGKSNPILFCLLSACLFLQSGKSAQADERYLFDKSHTTVSFSVSRLGFFQTQGEFNNYDGDFVFCIEHPNKDSITITLYPASIHTPSAWMEKELRGADFFNAARFPHMRFVSTAVKLIDKDNATITGNLTLLGITKPITLDAHFEERGDDPDDDDYVVTFSASGVIKRSDFGMNYLMPIIGDEVRLHIQVRGIEEK